MSKNKKFLIIFSVILIAMVLDWMYVVNLFAITYERNDVSLSIETYFKDLDEKKYSSAANIYQYDDKTYSTEDLGEFLSEIYGSISDVNISQKSDDMEDTVSYDVFNDNNELISTIVARKTGKQDLFSIDKYVLSSNDLEKYANPKIRVPEMIDELYINDTKFSDILENDYIDIYKELDNDKLVPKYNVISLGEFAVLNNNFEFIDNNYNYEIIETDSSSYEVIVRPNDDDKEEYVNLTENVATTYAKFIAKDTSLYKLRKLLYKKSSYYDIFSYYTNKWYTSHEDYRFENIEVTDIRMYSENHFSAHISFDHIAVRKGIDHVSELDYTIYFIRDNGEWLCSSILLK